MTPGRPTAPRRQASGHRVLPHPADVGLAFWGPTREAAFEEAARGLVRLLGVVGARRGAPGAVHRWKVDGVDDVERLFKLLAQLVWVADVEGLVPTHFEVHGLSGGALEVLAQGGGPPGSSGYDVKAVTYHQMAFGPTAGGWRGRAFFDI